MREGEGKGEREDLFSFVSYKGTNTINEGSTLMTQLPAKVSPSDTATLGIMAYTYEFWGDADIQSIAMWKPQRTLSR